MAGLFCRRREHHEIIAAILFPRAFIVSISKWLVFTVTESIHAIRSESGADEFLAASQGAAFTERTVIFLRAAFVAIAFHAHRGVRMALQVFSHGSDFGFIRTRNRRAVVEKVNRVFLQRIAVLNPVGVIRKFRGLRNVFGALCACVERNRIGLVWWL